MTALRGAAIGVCVLALSACGGSGHKAAAKVVASKSASGTHASATASFKFRTLSGFSVHVVAAPTQRVEGGWVISCGYGMYQTSRDSADFARQAPFEVPIPANYTPPQNEQCELVAVATLARSGRVTIELRGRPS
jgi:hypothetical protein